MRTDRINELLNSNSIYTQSPLDTETVRLIRLAASNGHVKAAITLARLLLKPDHIRDNRSTEEHRQEAESLLRLPHVINNVDATYSLAKKLIEDKNLPQQTRTAQHMEAASLFRQAVLQGHSQAIFDYVEALKTYKIDDNRNHYEHLVEALTILRQQVMKDDERAAKELVRMLYTSVEFVQMLTPYLDPWQQARKDLSRAEREREDQTIIHLLRNSFAGKKDSDAKYLLGMTLLNDDVNDSRNQNQRHREGIMLLMEEITDPTSHHDNSYKLAQLLLRGRVHDGRSQIEHHQDAVTVIRSMTIKNHLEGQLSDFGLMFVWGKIQDGRPTIEHHREAMILMRQDLIDDRLPELLISGKIRDGRTKQEQHREAVSLYNTLINQHRNNPQSFEFRTFTYNFARHLLKGEIKDGRTSCEHDCEADAWMNDLISSSREAPRPQNVTHASSAIMTNSNNSNNEMVVTGARSAQQSTLANLSILARTTTSASTAEINRQHVDDDPNDSDVVKRCKR